MALLTAISEMAEAEKAQIAAQAEQQIAQINARTEDEIKSIHTEATSKLEDQLRIESYCILSAAKIEIRDRLVYEKNKALENIFSLARRQIEVLNSDTRKEILKKLINEAISGTHSTDVHLRISKADLPLWESLKEDFPNSISIESCQAAKGTVIVQCSDRSHSIDNSIEMRMEKAKEVMRVELGDLLFGDQTTGANTK